MEAVGVVTFIRHSFHHAKLLGINSAESAAQVFTRCAIEAKRVTGLFFPLLNRVAQMLNDFHGFFAQLHIIINMLLLTKQRHDGFMYTDITQ
ncbi:Uncharacterised protein [Vibrio cholerae]|nr:Uncharacterised protein [Vibrio cholerae]